MKFIPRQWHRADSPFVPRHSWDWANVAYVLIHITIQFLVKDEHLVDTRPRDPTAVSCLQWLTRVTRSMRARHSNGSQSPNDPQETIYLGHHPTGYSQREPVGTTKTLVGTETICVTRVSNTALAQPVS